MSQNTEKYTGMFGDLAKQIIAKNDECKRTFDAMREAIRVAEESIATRSSKILQQLEPMTKMLEVNQTIASELTTNVSSALKSFLDQQTQIEALYKQLSGH
jgi:rhamnose utilization protein RhaD (predicted bifunctional aldolase and dehydrogenase)